VLILAVLVHMLKYAQMGRSPRGAPPVVHRFDGRGLWGAPVEDGDHTDPPATDALAHTTARKRHGAAVGRLATALGPGTGKAQGGADREACRSESAGCHWLVSRITPHWYGANRGTRPAQKP